MQMKWDKNALKVGENITSKIHHHDDQFDGHLYSKCGRGSKIFTTLEFEATDKHLRCKLCSNDWFPYGQPDWHLEQSKQKLVDMLNDKR